MKQVTQEALKKWVIDQYSSASLKKDRASGVAVTDHFHFEGEQAVLERLTQEFDLGLTLSNGKTLLLPEEDSFCPEPTLKNSPFHTKIGISGPFGYTEVVIPVFDGRELGRYNTERILLQKYFLAGKVLRKHQNSRFFKEFMEKYTVIVSVTDDQRTKFHRTSVYHVTDRDVNSLLFAIVERNEAKP